MPKALRQHMTVKLIHFVTVVCTAYHYMTNLMTLEDYCYDLLSFPPPHCLLSAQLFSIASEQASFVRAPGQELQDKGLT
jgi:hypothetical protein